MPIADTAHPALAKVADTELIGPDSKPTDTLGQAHSIEIPLERQISFKFPTVITPSEQAEDVRHIQTAENGVEQVLTAKQAAKAYAGKLCLLCILCNDCCSGLFSLLLRFPSYASSVTQSLCCILLHPTLTFVVLTLYRSNLCVRMHLTLQRHWRIEARIPAFKTMYVRQLWAQYTCSSTKLVTIT